jgi:hypothetical protein
MYQPWQDDPLTMCEKDLPCGSDCVAWDTCRDRVELIVCDWRNCEHQKCESCPAEVMP